MCDYAKFRNSGVTNGFSVPSIWRELIPVVADCETAVGTVLYNKRAPIPDKLQWRSSCSITHLIHVDAANRDNEKPRGS